MIPQKETKDLEDHNRESLNQQLWLIIFHLQSQHPDLISEK